jgi:hypothetical protein
MRGHAFVYKGFRGCTNVPSASRGDVVRLLPHSFAGRSRILADEPLFAGIGHLG